MNEKQSIAKSIFKLFLKIVVTIFCFWYISTKIDWSAAWQTMSRAKWYWLVPAFLLFILSKIISAIRLNLYFKNAGVTLSTWQNLKLYSLGMFYNLFLPGSISGDAYKVILLKKTQDASYKKTSAAVLLDRFSGLLGLGLILAVFSFFVIKNGLYISLIVAAVLLSILVFYIILYKWLPDFLESFLPAFLLGILVQGLQVLSIICIMKSVNVHDHFPAYLFIFLLSSVVSVLPLTIGGLGIRELVFLEGSKWFGLVQETSVGISLLFYLVTVISSAIGAWYVFADPLEKNKDPLRSP